MSERLKWWAVVYGMGIVSAILSIADVIVADYEVPAQFYPFAGIVIGAALARLGAASGNS
jgi:hypothetical protein